MKKSVAWWERWTSQKVSEMTLSCRHNHTHPVCQDLEPLLAESRRRFVLFPIQYPDVSQFVHTSFVAFSHSADRYGECTSKPKHPSGVWKRSTWLMISTTGTNVLMTTSASSYRAF